MARAGVGDARCFGTLGNQTKDLVLGEDLALGKLHKNKIGIKEYE
jgi:hypothetical protein